jgi:hypothetical protein
MATWKDDVEAAIASLGGEAQLEDIYNTIAKRRRNMALHWRSTVRQILQAYDPESTHYYRGKPPIFYHAGKGRWGLLRAKRKA